MGNEIEKVETQAIQLKTDAPPLVQIAQLLASGVTVDVEAMKAMQGMGERYEANEARKAFAADFTVAQSNIEGVAKDKINPQTNSKYAGLDNVIELAKPVYTNHGFSVIFYEGETGVAEHIRVCADVLHKAGHKEKYFYDVPMGGVGIKGTVNMTKIHGKATSVSYGRRYLMCMIWNIPTPDDDGNSAAAKNDKPIDYPPLTDEEQKVIDEVTEKLLDVADQQGRKVIAEQVAHVLYRTQGKYPDATADVAKIAKWLAGKYLIAVTEKIEVKE